jgi:hypothetical protein
MYLAQLGLAKVKKEKGLTRQKRRKEKKRKERWRKN